MPGGYGDDTSLPWAGSGDTGASWNIPSSGGGNDQNQNNNVNWDALINAGNTDNNVGITTLPSGTISVPEIPGQVLSNEDKIWELATQAYLSNPGYELSFEGKEYAKQLAEAGITKGSPEYQKNMIQAFGMPQVTSNINQVQKVDPMDPKYQKSFKGQELIKAGIKPGSAEWNAAFVPELKLSGQGQYLMDQYDNPTGSYQEQVDDYYAMREAEQAQQTGGEQNYGYGYGHDSGGGGGYYGGVGGYAPAHRRHQAFLDQLYKGRLAGGKEVHKMLASNQKIEAANILSGLSQGAQAFAMDPKQRGILAVLQA